MKKFSVIIAAYNEEKNIANCIVNARKLGEDVEIIVVDGESQDGTYDMARSLSVKVYRSPKGRGQQLNKGAANASGEILVFLHADTKLPDDALDQLNKAFSNKEVHIGTFRMQFEPNHWILKLYAFFTRFDTILTSFGDQVMVVRREFFDVIGGFPLWPLFEDVHFFRLARRRTKVRSFKGPVVTSARGFQKKGIILQQFFNGFLILKYLLGASPEKLYEQYYRK